MITVLFFLDDVTPENGPLEVIPGTHTGPLYEHWHDSIYTGAVASEVMAVKQSQAIPCYVWASRFSLFDAFDAITWIWAKSI